MIVILLPLLIAIVGALVYALAQNPKLVELGRIAFFCGMLVTTMLLGRETFRLSVAPDVSAKVLA